MKNIFFALFCAFFSFQSFGQCTIQMEDQLFMCNENSDSAKIEVLTDAEEPYVVNWQTDYQIGQLHFYASSFLNDTTLLNPIFKSSSQDRLFFFLSITDANGKTCKDTIEIGFSQYVYLTVDCRSDIAPGDTTSVGAIGKSNFPPFTYEWSPNHNISDINAANPDVWPEKDSTRYTVTMTDSIGCVGGSSCIVYFTKLFTDDTENELDFKIYPNPVNDILIFEFQDPMTHLDIEILDINGVKILNEQLKNDHIDISELPKGFYILNIIQNEKIVGGRKMVKK